MRVCCGCCLPSPEAVYQWAGERARGCLWCCLPSWGAACPPGVQSVWSGGREGGPTSACLVCSSLAQPLSVLSLVAPPPLVLG